MLKRKLIVFLSLLGITFSLKAQPKIFASLIGSPTVNTQGWNFTGNARIGDTPGDANSDSDEVIVCPKLTFTSGGIFYSQPANLALCSKFTVEFKFRMFEGTAADGLAFCFLQNPPTGFQNGQGIGIPSNPRGLMVVFDTFDNDAGSGTNDLNPEIQIRYGNGSSNYSENPVPPQPTLGNQTYLRSNNYQDARIEYNAGQILVFVNNQLKLTGFYNIAYSGYFGFTAATGQSTDVHSIKDVFIKTEQPYVNAGPDREICPGDTVILGTTGLLGTSYKWNVSTNLSSDIAARPVFTGVNTGLTPIVYSLILRADTIGIPCPSYDTVSVTVHPFPVQPDLGEDRELCFTGGDTALINPGTYDRYAWSDSSTGPSLVASKEGTYWVRVSNTFGCTVSDTIAFKDKCPFTLDFPNVFTPNGDGKNDVFKPKNIGLKALSIRVYDRWGNKVYEQSTESFSENSFTFWNGEGSKAGQYSYMAEGTSLKGETRQFHGFVMLIR